MKKGKKMYCWDTDEEDLSVLIGLLYGLMEDPEIYEIIMQGAREEGLIK